jgi:hypothetical protein
LNYIKQRLFETDKNEAQKIERFQNPVDSPYRKVHGAAALYSSESLDTAVVCTADTQKTPAKGGAFQPHPNSENLRLVVIKGSEMMTLVHELYRRAADEA